MRMYHKLVSWSMYASWPSSLRSTAFFCSARGEFVMLG